VFKLFVKNLKKVSLYVIRSIIIQQRKVIIAIVNGTHKMLYEKDNKKFPFNNARVARPIPQPGHGILVTILKKQNV